MPSLIFAVHKEHQSLESSGLFSQLDDPKRSFHGKASSEIGFSLHGLKPTYIKPTTWWRDSASDIVDSREDESHDNADTMKDDFRQSDPVSAECDSTTPKLFKLKISNSPKKKRKVKSWMREQAARKVVDSFECSDEEEEVCPREESSVSTVLLQPKQGKEWWRGGSTLMCMCACACVCVHTHVCVCVYTFYMLFLFTLFKKNIYYLIHCMFNMPLCLILFKFSVVTITVGLRSVLYILLDCIKFEIKINLKKVMITKGIEIFGRAKDDEVP